MSSRESAPSVREVLTTTLSLVRAHATLLVGTALVCLLPGFASEVFVEPFLAPSPFAFSPEPEGLVGSVAAYRLYFAVAFVITSVLHIVALAVGASVAVTAHRGQTISAKTIMRRVRVRIASLAGVGVLMGLAALLGMMCFVLPGVYLHVLFALAPAVCVTEFTSPMTALERSAALIEGRRMHVLGLLGVLIVPRLALVALIVAHAFRISLGEGGVSFLTALSIVTGAPSGWFGATLAFVADLFYVLFGGVGFGVVYARCARLPTVDVARTIDVFD